MNPPRTGGSAAPGSRIDDYAVVGDLRTAALVSRFGSIDWACLPRFASPSVFGRLLDRRRGGTHEVVPMGRATSRQAYLPSTAILETTFNLGTRRSLKILDFLPLGPLASPGRTTLIRLVEATGGPVRIRVTCEPRFDYGRLPATWTSNAPRGWYATGGTDVLDYRLPGEVKILAGRAVTDAVLPPAEPFVIEMGWGPGSLPSAPASELLRETERYWLDWVHRSDTPLHVLAGRWHRWVERAEITLKLLQDEASGAFVAAPTTSLPEWPGGHRNWDYRFAWVRDAAFTAEALLLLGHVPEATRFLRWVVGRLDERAAGGPLRVVYGSDGGVNLDERPLRHLAGFAGSRPVRVGNGAATQFQLDIYGELLDAAYMLSFAQPKEVESLWPRLAQVAREVLERWREPDRGIWEARGPPRQYVHSKLMAWVALERSARLARRFGDVAPVASWQAAADQIRFEIVELGFDGRQRAFVQAFGRRHLDASALRIPLVGFLPFQDERVLSTIEAIDSRLGSGAFLYRYRAPDGLAGREGTFLPCAFWMVECLARCGRREEALKRFEALLGAASPVGLFSEEYDPGRAILLGNYPQGLSHIGMLRAALALGLADIPPRLEADSGAAEGVLRLRKALQRGEPPAWED
ncbi:MAG TPA: glycoside hydrolase family 15 protein [Thermoplasmata archaeon]|nr:glycoside hydrolase family 15 protein [Thermoplasmata archaeon]